MNHEAPYRAGIRLCLNFRSPLEHAVWGVSPLGGKKRGVFFDLYSFDVIVKESQFRGANSDFPAQTIDLFTQMG